MSNPVSVISQMVLTVTELLGVGNADTPNGEPFVHNGLNLTDGPLTSTSTNWPNAQVSGGTVTLSGGTGTIDLTSLPGANNGPAVNGTGQKVRKILLTAPSGNAAVVTITPGASNGYTLFGSSSSLGIDPGETTMSSKANAAPSIDATHKILTLTGTTGDKLNFLITLG